MIAFIVIKPYIYIQLQYLLDKKIDLFFLFHFSLHISFSREFLSSDGSTLLCHVDSLLDNDSEINNYTTTIIK
jgi:hypothetical protein